MVWEPLAVLIPFPLNFCPCILKDIVDLQLSFQMLIFRLDYIVYKVHKPPICLMYNYIWILLFVISDQVLMWNISSCLT